METLNQIRQLILEHGANFAFVVNHSGGKDSQRMLGYIREQFPTVKTYVVMADTGFEHTYGIAAEEFARQSAARFGLELAVVRNTNKTYLEMVERRGMFPSASTRQCTSDLKRDPINRFIRNLSEKVIVNCTGIRAAESASRAKQSPFTANARISTAGRLVWNWMPIFGESLADVLAWHHANAMPLHPVYVAEYHVDGTAGGYLRRLSCRVCIFSTPADLRAIYQHDRQAFDTIAALEQRIGFTMKAGKSLFQILDQSAADDRQYGSEESPCSASIA